MIIIFDYFKHHMKYWIISDTRFFEEQVEFDIDLNRFRLYPASVDDIPPDMLYPIRKPIRIITFVDVDHIYDLKTRQYVTGILILTLKPYQKVQTVVEFHGNNNLWLRTGGYDNFH